jgi:hypothetical protein
MIGPRTFCFIFGPSKMKARPAGQKTKDKINDPGGEICAISYIAIVRAPNKPESKFVNE